MGLMADIPSSPAGFSGEDLICIRGERVVFSGLDFTIGPGGALILTGRNGSGKSSLLRVMAGLLPPAAGVLYRDGEDVRAAPDEHRESLHYVGHLDAIKPVLTVTENLAFWAGIRQAPPQIAEALEIFGLTALADMPARLLSAGQKRRLNLARLAASPTPLWLLDEPTVALDTASVAALVNLIANHRAGGGMVVVSTHLDLGIDAPTALAMEDFAATEAFVP
jgi:heme exporter protein A